MESVNPYKSPLAESHRTDDAIWDSTETLTARFVFTSEHLCDTLSRYRAQHAGYRARRWIGYVAAFIFLLVAVFKLSILSIPQDAASAFMASLAIYMFFRNKIGNYITKRRFRKSPHYNTQQLIHLSDDGFRTESEIEQTDIKWAAFSKTVFFDDGVLLFRGPNAVVNWIPDLALAHDGDAPKIRLLLAAKVPTNNSLHGSGEVGRFQMDNQSSPPRDR